MSADERDHYANAVEGVAASVQTFNAAREAAKRVQISPATVDAMTTASVGLMAAANAIDATRATLALVDAVHALDATLRQVLTSPVVVNVPCEHCGGDRLRADFTGSDYCHAPGPYTSCAACGVPLSEHGADIVSHEWIRP